MKYSFTLCYELDAPLAVSVAMYLDCEHYVHLHESLSSSMDVIEPGHHTYLCRQKWDVFGIPVGQTYRCSYEPPATFLNREVRPDPIWFPSIYHLIGVRTTLTYYPTDAQTTLSELVVDMEIPFFLYPFRRLLQGRIEKLKIIKDLQDVSMMNRRAELFGYDYNDDYLAPHQFMLHKDGYRSCFGKRSEYFGPPAPERYRNVRWTNIKELDRDYVREYLKQEAEAVTWIQAQVESA